MKRRERLTDNQIAGLRPRSLRYVVADPAMPLHFVRVTPNGVKSFCISVRDPSQPAVSAKTGKTYFKNVWFTIGSTDVLKIEESREAARSAIKRIRAGKRPVEAAKPKPEAFKSVAENWLKRHVAEKKLRTQPEIERCLSVYVYPHWAARSFTEIKRSDVATLLDYIQDHRGARQADLVLGILRSISNWFATRDNDYTSPFIRGMGRDTAPARARILDDDELRKVWKQAEGAGTFGALIQVLLLTGQRRSAVLGMRWADISDDGVWTVAAEAREKGNIGSVALPKRALAIINAQPRFASNPYVFAGRTVGPINSVSKAKLKFDKACGVTGWTLHDLRRCARSLMSRAGVSSEHAERVLGHIIAGVEGTYDRHAYSDEKSAALAKLAAQIDTILNGEPSGKVVRLRKARADA